MHISHSCSRLFLIGFIMTLSFGLRGQNQPDIKSLLSQSEYSKYQKAERFISKGSGIIKSEDSSGKTMPSSSQAKREIDMKKEQAYLLLKDGYNMKLRVLNGYFEDYLNKNSEIAESDKQKVIGIQSVINDGTEKSKKLYAQSRKTSKLSKSIKIQEEAQQIQLDAIDSAEKGLMLVQDFKEVPVEKQVVLTEDTVAKEVVESKPIIEEKVVEPEVVAVAALPVAVVVADKEEVKEETETVVEVVEENPVETNVYFSIQVLADKKPATVTQQKMVYKGSREVIENMGSGWYRYSVGKFSSYSKAASTMKTEGIKGFVVAYNGSERITTSEAKKILGGVK